MLTRLSYLLLCTTFGVLSKNVTFHNVEVQCQTEDYLVFNVVINSSNNLKSELPDKVTRITIIGHNVIPSIYENSISDLPSLKVLQLRQQGVEDIEKGAFKNVPQLEVLRLNGNKLREINEGVFNNLSLVFLNLDHNLIETISKHAFDHLPKLELLDVSYNKLKSFHPEWLRCKPLLTSAIFTYNEIENLPEGTFRYYHNDVDLSNNRIKNVSFEIFGFDDDKRVFGQLWLGDNHIDRWDVDFVRGVQIRALDMSRNQLECLNGNFEHFFVATRTRIDGNPWNCECLLKIAKWVLEHKKRISMRASARNCNSTGEFPRVF